MKYKKFEEIYNKLTTQNNSEINNIWEQVKIQRKKRKILFGIIWLFLDSIIIYSIINQIDLFYQLEKLSFIHYVGIFMAFAVSNCLIGVVFNLSLVSGKKTKEYNSKYKEVFIKELIENFYDNVNYFYNRPIPKLIYNEGDYGEVYNRYYSDDYIKAKINNKYNLDMAEVKIQRESKDSDGDTTVTTLFNGIFSKIVIDKSINSQLRIEANLLLKFRKNKLEMDSRRV